MSLLRRKEFSTNIRSHFFLRWYSRFRRSSRSDLSKFNLAYFGARPARTSTLTLSLGLRCSFANPSGCPAGDGLNTNFQFVRAYRPGAQERDTNARCNQRIAKEGALERNTRINPRSSSVVLRFPDKRRDVDPACDIVSIFPRFMCKILLLTFIPFSVNMIFIV